MGDHDYDTIPTREPRRPGGGKINDIGMVEGIGQHTTQQRRMVAHLDRDELEDKYLRMHEENLILKKHARKQEDKIKRMATKLLRLVSDKKKENQEKGVKRGRDIETEEMLEDLHGKIRNLEAQNSLLKEKLMVMKQQLTTQGTRHTPYSHVQSRINTGIPKPPPTDRIAKNIRVAGPKETHRSIQSPGLPRYGHSLLEEARAENRHLEGVIEQCNEQLNIYEQDIEFMKEQLRIKEAEFEEDLLKIKQQMTGAQRVNLQENVDLIRLQREIKDKSTKLTALQGKYTQLEENLRTVKSSHDQVLHEMEKLNHQLQQEQNRVLSLQNELKHGSASQRTIVELEEQVSDLKRENGLLRDENDKLVSSAFDLEREREWRKKENTYVEKIHKLEATIRADVSEKGGVLDKLTEERENAEKMEKELRDFRIQHLQLKEQYDELKEKMKFFTKESAIDFSEIEEALVLVKQRKEKSAVQELDFLEKVDEEKQKDLEKEILRLEAEHAETVEELEKTRNMLITQHKINRDYQMEVEAVTKKMEENRQEYDTKLAEYAQLLDIRAARIKKLESQMRDVAYGTKQYKIAPEEGVEEDVEEIDETLHLQRGENLFEIHVSKVMISADGIKQLGDEEPTVFCTWEFFEFETQSTPVIRGPRPEFDFTSQYVVKVDDFFLHHIQKESTTLEFHQAFGTDFRTVAACQLKFRDILDKPQGRVHGTAQLSGVSDGAPGLGYGTVEYWVRLKVPMDQALRLYKERTKALGYIESNQRSADKAVKALDDSAAERPDENVNELHIKLIRCDGVGARRENVQPSPYVVYKFFDFPDHDTSIVHNTNNPSFNDHQTFPVVMAADLDMYLKAQPLQVYVFDDTDPEEASYLGVAQIPLIPLAHDKPVKGRFELKKEDGTVNGSIDVHLKWQYTYIPPKVSTKTPAQILATTPQKREKIPLMPSEELVMPSPVVAAAPPHGILKTPKPPPGGPAAASTPLPAKSAVASEESIFKQPRPPPEPLVRKKKEVDFVEAEPVPKQPKPRPQPRVVPEPKQVVAKEVVSQPIDEDSELSESTEASQGDLVSSEAITPMDQTSTLEGAGGEETGDDAEMIEEEMEEDEDEVTETEQKTEDEVSDVDSVEELIQSEAYKEVSPRQKLFKEDSEAAEEKDMTKAKGVLLKAVRHRRETKEKQAQSENKPSKAESDEVSKESEEELDTVTPGGQSEDESEATIESLQDQETKDSKVKKKQKKAIETKEEKIPDKKKTKNPFKGMFGGKKKEKDRKEKDSKSSKEKDKKGKNKKTKTDDEEEDWDDEDDDDIVAQELGEAKSKKDKHQPSEDTMFEEEREDEEEEEEEEEEEDSIEDDVEIPVAKETAEDEQSEETDSEGVVMTPAPRSASAAENSDIVVVEIAHLSLDKDSNAFQDPAIKMLFVEYRFLGCPPEELETPVSLPKPRENQQIAFNFRKVFHVDAEKFYERRQYLASMLLPDDPDDGRICFTIVSEPPEDNMSGDCEDVGHVYVSVRDILSRGRDVIDEDVPILDAQDGTTEIGTLNVTVECLAALKIVKEEMIDS